MEFLIGFLKVAGVIAVMTLIIPLMVAGGAGSWRAGWKAWIAYLKIMGGFVLVGGGLGVVMAISEHGLSLFWDLLTH